MRRWCSGWRFQNILTELYAGKGSLCGLRGFLSSAVYGGFKRFGGLRFKFSVNSELLVTLCASCAVVKLARRRQAVR